MSLLRALKGVAREVVKEAMAAETNTQVPYGSENTCRPQNLQQPDAYQQLSAYPGQGQFRTELFYRIDLQGSNQCGYDSYETAMNGEEKVCRYTFMLADGFVEFDAHVVEIEASYIYSPEDMQSGYSEFDDAKPILFFGIENKCYRMLDQFLKTGIVPQGCEIVKLENCIADYKTIIYFDNKLFVSYFYHKKYDTDSYYAVNMQLPLFMRGSELGIYAENSLIQIVSTLGAVE